MVLCIEVCLQAYLCIRDVTVSSQFTGCIDEVLATAVCTEICYHTVSGVWVLAKNGTQFIGTPEKSLGGCLRDICSAITGLSPANVNHKGH